jgi:hypothetical protein
MSVDFQRNTRLYIPEDSTLHNHHCENLKSCTDAITALLIQYSLLKENFAVHVCKTVNLKPLVSGVWNVRLIFIQYREVGCIKYREVDIVLLFK